MLENMAPDTTYNIAVIVPKEFRDEVRKHPIVDKLLDVNEAYIQSTLKESKVSRWKGYWVLEYCDIEWNATAQASAELLLSYLGNLEKTIQFTRQATEEQIVVIAIGQYDGAFTKLMGYGLDLVDVRHTFLDFDKG